MVPKGTNKKFLIVRTLFFLIVRTSDRVDFMSKLPDRHPQKDFFVLDVADVILKSDTVSMEHPLFSLATKPDMRHLRYENGDSSLTIIPSGIGLPTIFDKDILVFCISQLMHRKNQGKPYSNRVHFSAHALLCATNRPTSKLGYQRLEAALSRLRGTTFKTNIFYEELKERHTQIFGLIDGGGFVEVERKGINRLSHVEVVLSDWVMDAIEGDSVLTLSNDYFRIRRPLERRLYEIVRKHCGHQKKWKIGLEKLQLKTGSNAPLYRFRFNLRQIIEEDDTPDYRLELTADDMVIVRPRSQRKMLSDAIRIPPWAEEKAREVCQQKGQDYYGVEAEWKEFARTKEPPRNAGGAFVGFCKNKPKTR